MKAKTSKTRAAVFIRVSTLDQNLSNQLVALEHLAAQRGLQITATFQEHISGTARNRPELDRMVQDAKAGKFDVLLIWALDRLGRTMAGTFNVVLDLDQAGVKIVSAQEPWLDMEGPVRSLLVAVFAWCAAQEKTRLVERVRLGMDRARREGRHLGRPRTEVDLERVLELRGQGMSVRAVAREMSLAPATVHRVILAAEAMSQNPLAGERL